jgi:hypothetical protein
MRASLSSIRTRDQRSFLLKPNAESFIDVKSCRDWDYARGCPTSSRASLAKPAAPSARLSRPNKKQPYMTLRTAVALSLAMP